MRADFKAVDFFCGAGGMSQGMKRAGIHVIAGIDNAPECEATYRANHPGTAFILKDVKSMKKDFLEQKCGVGRNDDDMIFIGCSPCQYWSILNTDRRPSKKTKGLLMEFLGFVKYYKPGYVVVENVPGIKRQASESKLNRFINTLGAMGYQIAEGVLNAKDHGVPQSRKRFLLIASRVIGDDVRLPECESSEALLKDFIGEHNGFPKLKSGHRDPDDFMSTVSNLSEINLRRLRKTPKNGGNRFAWKNDPELQLVAYIGRDDSFRDVYGRMRWDKPASTLTTRFTGISNGRFAHPTENRGLSLREGATLQTFDDDYRFESKSISVVARLIGNAVPPEFAYRIARSVQGAKK